MLFTKKLEGIKLTDELNTIVEKCCASVGAKKDGTPTTNTDEAVVVCQGHMTRAQAILVLRSFYSSKADKAADVIAFVPITVIQAMKVVWSESKDTQSLKQLESSLRSSALVFTQPPPPSPETKDEVKFRKRMDRLRLYQEEMNYRQLTTNIDNDKGHDDINARSMTYAASVGLNMIIAPLSFGCFMYFFAGTLLDWCFGEYFGPPTGNVDVKRVLIGVVSGVAMLFIEMILFVIRTHEFERHTRKKAKKTRKKAFGHYTSDMPRETTMPILAKNMKPETTKAAANSKKTE